jgi:hypothetical protein
VNTQNELLACILDAVARVKERHDQLIRTTRDLRDRVSKCIEVDGAMFEHLLQNLSDLFFCIYCTQFKMLMLETLNVRQFFVFAVQIQTA